MVNENWDLLTPQQIVQKAVVRAESVADLYSGPVGNRDDIRDAINVAKRFVKIDFSVLSNDDLSVLSKEARSAATKAREASVATLKSVESYESYESYYAGIAAYRTAQSAEAAITVIMITSAVLEFSHDGSTYNPASLFRQDAVNRAQEACDSASQAEI